MTKLTNKDTANHIGNLLGIIQSCQDKDEKLPRPLSFAIAKNAKIMQDNIKEYIDVLKDAQKELSQEELQNNKDIEKLGNMELELPLILVSESDFPFEVNPAYPVVLDFMIKENEEEKHEDKD